MTVDNTSLVMHLKMLKLGDGLFYYSLCSCMFEIVHNTKVGPIVRLIKMLQKDSY